MPFGLFVFNGVSERGFRFGLGVIVALAATALAFGWRIRTKGPVVDAAAGITSGLLNTSFGTNGPPLVIGLQGQSVDAERFRATLAGVFVLSGTGALALFAWRGRITSNTLQLAAIGIVPMLLGQFAGRRVSRLIPAERFRVLVLVLLYTIAATSIVNAIV